MARFAAGLSQHPVPSEAVGEVVGQVLEQLEPGAAPAPPELAVLFTSPHHVGALEDVAGAVRSLLRPATLVGTTAVGVVGGGREVEEEPGLALLVAELPGAQLQPVALHLEQLVEGPAIAGWPTDADAGTFITLADPFSFPGDGFLAGLNDARPDVTVIGGLASAARGPGGNRLILDDRLLTEGAVGVFVEGGVTVDTVVSQGCRPIGEPLTVTAASGNVIQQLAGKPAVERLQEAVETLDEAERELLSRGLHVGRVVDEHKGEFERGDFLIRNVMGIDRGTGSVAVGDVVDVGHTVQFQLRDAASADDDLRTLLAGHSADAALVFTCNGRGRHLFGEPDHDAGLIDALLGPLPAAGMFCAGELGPVGGRNFLHGFTASVALFRG